jgi:hypothetical protein
LYNKCRHFESFKRTTEANDLQEKIECLQNFIKLYAIHLYGQVNDLYMTGVCIAELDTTGETKSKAYVNLIKSLTALDFNINSDQSHVVELIENNDNDNNENDNN